MKSIYEALNIREGNLMAAYLIDRGIPAEVKGGAHHSVRGELVALSGMLPQIWVLDDGDEARGRELVREYEQMLRNEPEGDPWVCPACGESLEPQFQSCWKCQAEKPA